MKAARFASALYALGFPFMLLVAANGCSGCTGCSSKEDDTPITTAAAITTTTPTPTPTMSLVPEEDAGVEDAADAAADAPKVTGGADPTGVRACCNALSGNVNSAPLDQKPMYIQAAMVCQGLVNNPQGRAGLIQLRGLLRGANLPSSCK